jgi:hypothetical protein
MDVRKGGELCVTGEAAENGLQRTVRQSNRSGTVTEVQSR